MDVYGDVKIWFKQEILYWRIAGCIIYLIALQLLVTIVIAFLLNANLFSPFQSLNDGSAAVFSLSAFASNVVLSALTTLLVLSYATEFKMHPIIFSSVSERIIHYVNVWRLMTIVGYFFSGAIMAIFYLNIARSPYGTLSRSCDDESLCLNNAHVIVVFSAGFVSFIYAVGLSDGTHGCIRFPFIQRQIFVQIKSIMPTKICESFHQVLSNLKWFLIVYTLLGFKIENLLANSFHWNIENSSIFARLCDLIDVNLWWSIFIVDAAVHFVLSSLTCFFGIFITEKLSFPVETPFENLEYRTLKNALKCTDNSIINHLTFLDLSLSSQYSAAKRKEIFSLSIPGGHPRHWNVILESCLRMVQSITEQIAVFCEPPSKSLIETIYPRQSNTDMAYEMLRHRRFSNLNFLNNNEALLLSGNVSIPLEETVQQVDIITSSMQLFQQKVDNMRAYIINTPLVAYFIKESVETRAEKIFVSCQIHIWAIETLSFLVAASFKEDTYGVVQKDLPTILACLLDLQQALNKFKKYEITLGPIRRSSKNQDSWPDQLKASLKFAVKSALYHIVTTFGSHINAVSLSNEHRRHLNQYLSFQE